MSEVKSTEYLITLLKSGEYDGVDIMQTWCRLRDLTAQLTECRAENAKQRELMQAAVYANPAENIFSAIDNMQAYLEGKKDED